MENGRGRLALLGVSVALLLLIWWPYEFSLSALESVRGRTTGWGLPLSSLSSRDTILNFIAFIPLGWAGARTSRTLIWVAAYAFGLSLLLEVGEIFQLDRAVSVFDVMSNTAGAITGMFSWPIVRRALGRLADAPLRPGWITLGGVAIAGAAFVWLQAEYASLDAWSRDYPLQIGNEANQERFWCGDVQSIRITAADQVWTKEAFDFIERQAEEEARRIDCVDDVWLQSATPPSELVDAVKRSGRFRIRAVARSYEPLQYGPARLVSLSVDHLRRNFTMGQEGGDLIIRVRRRWAGLQGTKPFYRVEGVFDAGVAASVFVDTGSDSTVIVADGQLLIDRHDISRKWWILFLGSYEWRENPFDVVLALPFWLLLLGPAGMLAGATASRQFYAALRVGALCAGSALGGFAVLRMGGVELGWESALWMPVAMVLSAWLGSTWSR